MTHVLDVSHNIGEDVGGLFVVARQEIPDDYLASLKSERLDSATVRAGELHRCASVPTHVADIWMAQGFNIYQEPAKAIVARLQRDGLDVFITTNKRI